MPQLTLHPAVQPMWPTRRAVAAVCLVLGLCAVGGPLAARTRNRAPDPARAVSAEVYTGRGYEIARTPNASQKDCQAATSDFEKLSGADFLLTETCHRGAPNGPLRTLRAKARIASLADNTRFRLSFFGGLVHQEYWILDHADDDSWLIMATPGGNYVWIMARRPALSPATLAAATARVAALGYAPDTLQFKG